MSVLDSMKHYEPTAEHGAMQIKRTLAMAFRQIEDSLSRVKQIVDRYGSEGLFEDLGGDRDEVVHLYRALKNLVEQNKPGVSIPDLK